MKNQLIILLLFLTHFSGFSQKVPNFYRPSGTNYRLKLLNAHQDFEVENYGGTGRKGYNAKCKSKTTANFEVEFLLPASDRELEYKFIIYSYEFDPSNGTPEYANVLYNSNRVEYSSPNRIENIFNYNQWRSFTQEIEVEKNRTYYAVIMHKEKRWWGWTNRWDRKYFTENFNFTLIGGANSEAEASLNNSNAAYYPSYYGQLLVHEYLNGGDMILDGSASSCEDRYYVQVEEFNIQNWTAIPGTKYQTGWIMGEAGTFNLTNAFPNSFHSDKFYVVTLIVGQQWNAEYLFVRKRTKSALIESEIIDISALDYENRNAVTALDEKLKMEFENTLKSNNDNPTIQENSIPVISELAFVAFPNPTNGFLNVEIDNAEEEMVLDIISYDGKIVKTMNIDNQNLVNMDLNDLANGIYIVRISSANQVVMKRILKQ